MRRVVNNNFEGEFGAADNLISNVLPSPPHRYRQYSLGLRQARQSEKF
ncbi:hypothetical protein C427_1772 [Paraglaciecola psychrophila 170]|uniref:Uncharacterized protein n=1 Tax=Paraglaciecola psychrophila 170 TaxID=1129794 RepID=M4RJW7_9ALTE|nr:hypothetical protein C427_1772 [Paraglaciecola psychrophila 170]